MSWNRLRGFCHRSREWSRATRGMELFEMAAIDLCEFADANSGFFVYRKRIFTEGIKHHKPKVYVPWGVFAKEEERLQEDVDRTLGKIDLLNPLMEQWMLIEDMPSILQEAWKRYGLLEIGIWPLVSREQMTGAIVAAGTKPVSVQLIIGTGTALMDSCAAQVSLALDLILTGKIAENASQRDLLTGLLNRRGLETRLPQLLQECESTEAHIVLGLIDMDDLKQINDTQGHPAGDNALREIAEIISRNTRSGDIVARLGGDEFAVLMQLDQPDAYAVVERLREAVELESQGLSVSVGGALWGVDGDTFAQCYKIADERLYECKRGKKATAIQHSYGRVAEPLSHTE